MTEHRLFTPWTVGVSLGVHLLAVLFLALGPLARPRTSFTPGRTITIRVAPPLPRAKPAAKPAAPPAAAKPAAPAPSKKLPPPAPPSGEPPAPGAGNGAANGLSVQGATVAGIDAAYFPFDYYVSQMLNRLSSNWYRPPAPPGTACAVRFTVAKSGRILQAEVERPSGVAAFDRAALRAVLSSNPLPPLPFEYNEDKLGIHLKFE
jgi:protein TonB